MDEEELFTKHVPLAFLAIGDHMRAHDLPIPTAIDVHRRSHTIRMRIEGAYAGVDRWLQTLAIISEKSEPWGTGHSSSVWLVMLPVGIQFEIACLRTAPALSVVPA